MKISLFLPVLIILLSANLLIFDQTFYEKEIPDYTTYKENSANLLAYFLGAELNTEPYTEKELLHLEDVRRIIQISLALTIILSILLTIALTKDPPEHSKKELVNGGIYTLFLLFLLTFTLLFFSQAFTLFHQILFTNDYWRLTEDTRLIQMFPERFFLQSTKHILLYSLTFSLLCIAIGRKTTKK